MNTSIWPSIGALFFVLVLIPISLWLLKSAKQIRPLISGPVAILHRSALGPREQIVIIKIGEKTLLLGVTAQSINTLSDLTGQDFNSSPTTNPTVNFRSILNRLRKNETA